MKQINNTQLSQAINSLKITPEFKKFIKNCQKRLDKFDKTKKIKYSKIDSLGNKISEEYDFSSNIPMLEYFYCIKNNIYDICTCDYPAFLKWKKKFDLINLKGISKNIINGFFKIIQEILQYKTLRSGENNLLVIFFNYLQIKACVYCNSQHVIILEKSQIARFQVDHNLPKSEYPCFSITLANLYPSCNNCNHLKNNKDLNYELYYDITKSNQLKFKIETNDIVAFFQNKIQDKDLKIEFNQGYTKINDVLKVNQIYENHKDYAADLLRKYKVYTPAYLKQLTLAFESLFGKNPILLNQMIFNSSLDENDINKRVFSKLTLDLKKQLDELNCKTNI
jgi:hypothetical protein